MAAELATTFTGLEVRLLPSGGGVFEVAVDGDLIFSKKQLRRHAEPGEVVGLLKRRVR